MRIYSTPHPVEHRAEAGGDCTGAMQIHADDNIVILRYSECGAEINRGHRRPELETADTPETVAQKAKLAADVGKMFTRPK